MVFAFTLFDRCAERPVPSEQDDEDEQQQRASEHTVISVGRGPSCPEAVERPKEHEYPE